MHMRLLIIGSATRTIRAQELLRSSGINAKIKRLDNPVEGCVRALTVEDGQVGRAVQILDGNGVPVRKVGELSR